MDEEWAMARDDWREPQVTYEPVPLYRESLSPTRTSTKKLWYHMMTSPGRGSEVLVPSYRAMCIYSPSPLPVHGAVVCTWYRAYNFRAALVATTPATHWPLHLPSNSTQPNPHGTRLALAVLLPGLRLTRHLSSYLASYLRFCLLLAE